MIVKGVDPKTGKEADLELPGTEESFFQTIGDLDLSDAAVKRMISRLNISADAKSLLYSLSKATIRVGDRVLKMGRKLLDYVCHLAMQFPNTAFGVILAGVAGTLFSAIPGLGVLLGPIVAPILMLIGFVGGAVLDFQDKMLARKIAAQVAEQNERLSAQIDEKLAEIHSAANR